MKQNWNLRWPPEGLGLGAPFISAALTGREDRNFKTVLWQSIVLGFLTAAVMLLIDQILFAGVSLTCVRALGAEPVWVRIIIIAYSAVTEELIYRLGIMTLIAWITARVMSRMHLPSSSFPIWLGIACAAILFGLAHVANIPNAPHPIARAVTLNGIAGVVLGWLYWKRGLEAAVIAHFAANAFIYLGPASIL